MGEAGGFGVAQVGGDGLDRLVAAEQQLGADSPGLGDQFPIRRPLSGEFATQGAWVEVKFVGHILHRRKPTGVHDSAADLAGDADAGQPLLE
jgi:hypothetical protein